MKIILSIIMIGTFVFAFRQPCVATGKILGIFLVGFILLSGVAEIPDADDAVTYDKSYYSSSSNYSGTTNRKLAMTKETADSLRGTGYNNTRPGSAAEHNELKAAQIKCKRCGHHSDNGANSYCDACQKIVSDFG